MPEIILPPGHIETELELVGIDNGAASIIYAVSTALKDAGNPNSVINAWRVEAMSGDYNHLLRAAMTYTDLPYEEDY